MGQKRKQHNLDGYETPRVSVMVQIESKDVSSRRGVTGCRCHAFNAKGLDRIALQLCYASFTARAKVNNKGISELFERHVFEKASTAIARKFGRLQALFYKLTEIIERSRRKRSESLTDKIAER